MSRTVTSLPSAPRPADRAIPIGLNEAALDSPTFRASATHFADQIDAVERWLNGYVSSTSKLVHDVTTLEETIQAYLSKTTSAAADGIIENDYTFLALKRVGDGQREFWTQTLSSMKRFDNAVIEPIRSLLSSDLRNFKETKRVLEQMQKSYDSSLARYLSQSKTKEPSSLREDAFATYENRKAYIQASMDFCQQAPQLLFTIDKLLVKVCAEIWKDMKRSRDAAANATRWVREMDRVRGWAKEMETAEGVFKREIQQARRALCESTFEGFKPSRELEDYSTSKFPFFGSRGPVRMQRKVAAPAISEKQGWLFLRVLSGKPIRYHWIHRWYYCRDGVFGWLIPGSQGVLQGDEIGVLLCNAKPAVGEERRFCFEVKTRDQTMMLQAETQKELIEWMEVFEGAKKKAFETSVGRSNTSSAGAADPAFAISPPSAVEFSARAVDNPSGVFDEPAQGMDRATSLGIPGPDGLQGARQIIDASGTLGRRSFSARDLTSRDDGEGGRDHTSRLMQRFDLHRKNSPPSVIEAGLANTVVQAGGLASLITAGHSLLPVYPPGLAAGNSKQIAGFMPTLEAPCGSLAPLTMAKSPATTNLSRTAVSIVGENKFIANSRNLPTSILANYWGSSICAAMNSPFQPSSPRLDAASSLKMASADGLQGVRGKAADPQAIEPLPPNYPAELRAQHAQFRLLFPRAPLDEKLVLVFRAAWINSHHHDSASQVISGDGRIYLTPENMYFYGQQMGLVVAYSIHLDIIMEITTSAGTDFDTLVLRLSRGKEKDVNLRQISIKVFLDDVHLLHTQLNLLLDNLQAEEPMKTEEIISALIQIEKEEYDKQSPSADSWEDVQPLWAGGDGASPMGRGTREDAHHARYAHAHAVRPHRKAPAKLSLPQHPVVFEPEDMTELAAERHFETSAKACFHVLFGDKSFIFPKLYFEHHAQQIAQGHWTLVDQGKMRRDFHFQVDYVDMLGRSKSARIDDYQIIDVCNDHITYVVTHSKTAWHLPHSGSFKQVTKIVITHVAKSMCKLAIYIRIDWSKSPALSKNLVERQALRDAANDAEELAELTTDQIRKLGPRSRTNRAIEVYGYVGQQTQMVVFSPSENDLSKKESIKPRTLTALLLETARSFAESAISSLIMWAFAALKKLFAVVSAQRLILTLLGLSFVFNLFLTSSEVSTRWRENSAARFMQQLGVGPNPTMSRAIYIRDLDEASGAKDDEESFSPWNSTCSRSYKQLLSTTDMDASWEEAGSTLTLPWSRTMARRIRRTRQRLGLHRYDLLVAMRVVNRIEREMLHSEWENWLMHEKALCDDLASLLREGEDAKKRQGMTAKQNALRSLTVEKLKAVEALKSGYCSSCAQDYSNAMLKRRMTHV